MVLFSVLYNDDDKNYGRNYFMLAIYYDYIRISKDNEIEREKQKSGIFSVDQNKRNQKKTEFTDLIMTESHKHLQLQQYGTSMKLAACTFEFKCITTNNFEKFAVQPNRFCLISICMRYVYWVCINGALSDYSLHWCITYSIPFQLSSMECESTTISNQYFNGSQPSISVDKA